MPYIADARRTSIENCGDISSPGELNYAFTSLAIDYIKSHNNYQGINDVLGALEGAKLEFYRRWASPYEDYKIQENGDVYPSRG